MKQSGSDISDAVARAAKLLARRSTFADVYAETHEHAGLSFEEGEIRHAVSTAGSGAGLRMVFIEESPEGLRDREAFTVVQGLDPKQLIAAAQSARGAGRVHPVRRVSLRSFPPPGLRQMRDLLRAAVDAAAGPYISEIKGSVHVGHRRIWISTDGRDLVEQSRTSIQLSISVMAQKGSVRATGFDNRVACARGLAWPKEAVLAGKEAKRQATLALTSKPAPSGAMPVILSRGFGAVIFHEACGHGLEGDFHYKKTSAFTGKIGQKIASDCVTLSDNPTLRPDLPGSYAFDDEGVAARDNVLIEKGVLKKIMTDRRAACLLGMASSGNARRQGYSHTPLVRMTATYIHPGRDGLEKDIIADTERGFLAARLGGGEVDITTGDFSFSVLEGYVIRNGRIDYPVRGATLTGSGPQILMNVDRVGSDLEVSPGVCGKGQHVGVSCGQPTVRVSSILVGAFEQAGT